MHYLFDDIIFKYRFFFNIEKNKDSEFLYDVCFGLYPQKFDKTENDNLILDEENEVTDMYFIQDGVVGIGYYLMTQGLSKKQFKIGIESKASSYICDYYICFDIKSEFIYLAIQNVEAISLSKKYL